MQTNICRIESGAAETIANIEDLLTDILSRLPARSLLRLQCVSKHWLSLISGPEFCRQYTLRNPSPKISGFFPETIILKNYTDVIPLGDAIPSRINPPKAIYDCGNRIDILQSCNGLPLCQSSICPAAVYVFNPTTNRFKVVSYPFKSSSAEPDQCLYGLAFDPSKSPYYNVVCLAWQEIRVYSSQTRTWRIILEERTVRFRLSPQYSSKHAVYCDGALHWIRRKTNTGRSHFYNQSFARTDTVVHFYNLNEERLGAAPDAYLHYPSKDVVYRYFGESGGHLHLIDTYRYVYNRFDVMEMGRGYSGWFIKYQVDLNPIVDLLPSKTPLWYNCDFVVLSYAVAEQRKHPFDKDVLLLHVAGKVVSLSRRTKTVTTVCELTMKDNLLVSDSSHGYMESLACV